jgi:sugar O-acyltransferase (sialic acid O-acetyltransferase NeuD family)
MDRPRLIIIGGGGHAHSCIDIIEQCNRFEIAGIVDANKLIGQNVLGYKVIGADGDLHELRREFNHAFIAIGQIETADLRVALFGVLRELDFNIPQFISPNSYISHHSKIGDGSIVMHGAIVNANTEIGVNSIINSNALVEHDVFIGDHCHVSTASVLNGGVTVQSRSFIGSGSIILQNISIGKNCVIGASSLVRRDLDSETLYTG